MYRCKRALGIDKSVYSVKVANHRLEELKENNQAIDNLRFEVADILESVSDVLRLGYTFSVVFIDISGTQLAKDQLLGLLGLSGLS